MIYKNKLLKYVLTLAAFLFIGGLYAQERTVTGTISDGSGQTPPRC
ncbi:hypothetical protein KCTC52924_03491 [Arenibacter antarcticus]